MRKTLLITLVIAMVLCTVACRGNKDPEQEPAFVFGTDQAVSKTIRKVDTFPLMPTDFHYTDYAEAAKTLDRLVFDFAENDQAVIPNYQPDDPSTWNPLGFFDDARVSIPPSVTTIFYKGRTFGFPTYVGDRRSSSEGPYEAITMLPMVLGASFVGIDKSHQTIGDHTYDFVEMTKAFYDIAIDLVLNTTGNTVQGKSFWYDLYPQITIARLADLYPDDDFQMIVTKGADAWLSALPYMIDSEIGNDYEFTGFDVRFNLPFIGRHIEPPNGGLAFVFYAAYQLTDDNKYLEGAKTVLDWLQNTPRNPNYEAMSDFAFYVAAALNRLEGTTYDIQKMIDFVFENDAAFRAGWSVLSDEFNGYPVHGLVGDQQYAFAMNSFNLASTLVPTVKYDVRFADDVGTYILNLVNNAKWFFPRQMPLVNQTMTAHLAFDPEGSIIYEGLKRSIGTVSPVAAGDATAMFSQPSDLSLYSSSHLGYLGALVKETNVTGILQIDLNATDSFGDKTYPVHLYRNPYSTRRVIEVDVGSGTHDLFDAVTKQIVARNVTGVVNIDIKGDTSRVLWTLPANSTFTRTDHIIYVNDVAVAAYQAAVNIVSPGHSSYELRQGDVIRMTYQSPYDDPISNMVIRFGDIVVYDGMPILTFDYDKSVLPDTDYDLIVEIETENGLYDRSTSRVICR